MEVSQQPRDRTAWEPEIAPDGVDLGQIRTMLELSPTQRLERMQDFLDGVMTLRDGRKAGPRSGSP